MVRQVKVYLSRRNLLTLLSKLDRRAKGEETAATLIKCRSDDDNDLHRQSMKSIEVIAVDDAAYYHDREPTPVLPADEPFCEPITFKDAE